MPPRRSGGMRCTSMLLVALVLSASGCAGEEQVATADAGARAAAPPPAAHRPARPRFGPPRAWVRVAGRSTWMAFSSFCWTGPEGTGMCADYVAPPERTDLPEIAPRRGDDLTFH